MNRIQTLIVIVLVAIGMQFIGVGKIAADGPVVVPGSVTTIYGSHVAGDASSLAASDNTDYQLRRLVTDVQSRTGIVVTGISPTAIPLSLEVTLEGAVFARSAVVQTIELWDYIAADWVLIDSRNATNVNDSTVHASATGKLDRFVNQATLSVKARIHFQSLIPRQSFASNTDLFLWTIRDQKLLYQDMVFQDELVDIQFGSNVIERFCINGQLTVGAIDGVVNGQATVRFPDATIGTIFVQDDILEVVYGLVTIDVRTDTSNEIVEVNGMEVSIDSVMEVLFEENTFTGIGPLSDQSRALVMLQALAQTPVFLHNVEIAKCTRFGESFWCKAWCLAATTALIAIGAITCAALIAGCVGTIVIPGVGEVTCATALILCNGIAAGSSGLYGLIVAELWRS